MLDQVNGIDKAAHLLSSDHGVLDARVQSALCFPINIAGTGEALDLACYLGAVLADVEALGHSNSTPGRAGCRMHPWKVNGTAITAQVKGLYP